jgi:NAD(P)-dependent dehydrogenase (short-subunit alcohol dehydrogenase family)
MKKNFLISGGRGYLAQNLRKLMGEKDCFFILVDITKKGLTGRNISYISADISKGKILDRSLKEFFRENRIEIDGIVNTPAWNNFKSLRESDFEDIRRVIDTKVIGYTNVIKATLPYLKKRASIVNIGSVQAHSTRDFGAAYSAANGGVLSLTKALAIEFRKMRIRVNAVSPGGFDSDIYKKSHPDWRARIKRGQCLSTADISKVIRFLLSEESLGINGTEIIVDGGISALRAKSLDF